MPKRIPIDDKRKRLAVAMVLRGEPVTHVASAFGVSRDSIYDWLRPDKPPESNGFHNRVVDGRCMHCGARVVGQACVACTTKHVLGMVR